MSAVQKSNNNYRNTTKHECIYGWYPGVGDEGTQRKDEPKEIYANLGSRPPKEKSLAEAELLYNYHQSMKPSELIYRPKQSPEEALKPPWSLNLKTTGELSENAEKTIPEAFSRRIQSAPAHRHAPAHRIILKIPTPQLHNLFDGEAEEYFENNDAQSDVVDKQPIQLSELLPPEQYKQLNLNEHSEVIFTNNSSNIEQKIEELAPRIATPDKTELQSLAEKRVSIATNRGKKPLVNDDSKPKEQTTVRLILRPKTSIGGITNIRRSQSSASMKSKDRPKTSVLKSRPLGSSLDQHEQNSQRNSDNNTDRNNNNNLHQVIQTHNTEEQPTQYRYNHFYNSKANNQQQQQQRAGTPVPNSSCDATSVIFVEPAWVDNYLSTKHRHRNDIKVVDGHWKDQILNRGKFLAKRPSYYVKINIDKLKPDPPAPEVHYKAAETFFYNTLPNRKYTFDVDPHFISENLNVKKLELQNRPPSSGSGSGSASNAIRYRRDYAFAY